jgi:quinohemoprotein ethanol dehydrogenase
VRGARGDRPRDQARILAFKLGGTAQLPPLQATARTLAPPPPVTASEAQIARGAEVYAQNCALCHGQQARGGERDLRWIGPDVRALFDAIVLGGTREAQGMPSFADVLTPEDVAAVHGYIVARANEDWGRMEQPE